MKNEKAALQELLGKVRRADEDFGLIADGDRIAVGVSGGKDSLLLLKLLAAYSRFREKNFQVVGISVDCTGGRADFSAISKFCEELGVEFFVEPSNIFEVVFDIRKEKNPCSLCSKLRRGMLHSAAVRLGCNKVALGHHGDDLLETFLLSMVYEGRLSTFAPKSYLDRSNVTLIRPMIYLHEREVAAWAPLLPVLHNPCPADHHTEREYMKDLVKKLNADIPIARERMLAAIVRSDRYNLFPERAVKKRGK